MYFDYDNNIEQYNSFEYRIKTFCNSIGCDGHTKILIYVDAHCPTRSFYIFLQELKD